MSKFDHHDLEPESRSETPISPLQTAFPLPPSSHSSFQLPRHASLQAVRSSSNAFDVSHVPHFSSPTKTMSRSPSVSSYSTATNQPATPANVYPPPAYVAPFGASQVVSEAKRRFSDADDGDRGVLVKSIRDDMQFSASALALVNAFLDQLLYSFLANAKSTTLTALRPAVTEVLRSRLASEAIASAEEELSELLAGGEDEEEEMNQRQTAAERARKWDTELVWKRTRLRVMVYIRLGEMEDDDEERYVHEDELFHSTDGRFSHSSGLVSWAAAIFLTSVLEYVAEQVLQVAAKAAESRARRPGRHPRGSMSVSGLVTPIDGVTVEDFDTEKVALNSTLGRLWRTWRKSLRSNSVGNGAPGPPTPTTNTSSNNNFSRRLSRDHFNGAVMNSPRQNSFGGGPESVSAVDDSRPPSTVAEDPDTSEGGAEELPEAQYPEHVLAANIPLPMGDEKRDVDEIEVPGLARDPDQAEADGDKTPAEPALRRRNSLTGSAPLSFIASVTARLETSNELDFGFDQPEQDQDESEMASEVAIVLEAEKRPAAKEAQLNDEDATPTQEKSAPTEEKPAVPDPDPAAANVVLVTEDAESTASDEEPIEAEEKMAETQEEPVAAVLTPTVYVATRRRSRSVPTHFMRTPPVEQKEQAEIANAENPAEKEIEAMGVETGEAEREAKPEQKANAEEMAPLKREAPSDSKATLEKAANGDQPPTEDVKEKDESTGLLGSVAGAVVAGSAAAAAAAVAMVYGKDTAKKEPDEKDVDQKAAAKRDVVNLIKSGHFEPPSDTNTEGIRVEERDKQKHLVDVKRFSMSTGSKRSSVVAEQPNVAKRMSLVRVPSSPKVSQESFALDDGGEVRQPIAQPQHMSGDVSQPLGSEEQVVDIGVAKTSDTAVSTPKPDVPQDEFYHARDSFTNPAPKRRSRIVLGTSIDDGQSAKKESPPQQAEVPGSTISPQGFLERRSLTPKPLPLQVKTQTQQPSDPLPSPGRPSPIAATASNGPVANIGPRSPPLEKTSSPFRQSFSATVKESSSWTASPKNSISVSDSAVPVQEHPYVQQKMGGSKRDSRFKEEPDKSLPLTSASIKGPEDFEMFVQGGDTVKYTLTPVSVRGEPSPTESTTPYKKTAVARSIERGPSPSKKPSPPPIDTEDARTGRSQRSKQVTSVANETTPKSPTNSDRRRSISRPPVRNTSVHSRSGLMAREPQVMTESTADLADYLRSSTPTNEVEVRPLVHHRSTTSLASLRDAHVAGSRSQSPGARSSRSMSRSRVQAPDAPPLPPMPNNRNKSHMQPRGAQANVIDGTSELIDFIRSGPNGPGAGEARQHRIPRTVAPFRTTMDSDQLHEWDDRIPAQPDLKLNTNIPVSSITSSIKSASSHRTSDNSRSALLHSSNTTQEISHPAYGEHPPRLTSASARTNMASRGEPLTKTRFRNKDPYAIDLSDEEDDDFLTSLPQTKRVEESLIDFLRNSEPPETNNPRDAKTVPPRRGTAQGLKTLGADAVSIGRRGSSAARDGPQAVKSAPRNGNTAIAVGPITTSRQKLEARENGKASGSGTLDLANFLRGPGPTEPQRAPPTGQKTSSKASIQASTTASSKKSFREGFLGGIFSSRKGRKTYLDM